MIENNSKLKQWSAEEDRGQKWRRLTPLSVITNMVTNFVGWGLVVGLIVYVVQINDKQKEMLQEQMVNERNINHQDVGDLAKQVQIYKDQEAADTKCLTKEVFQCCGERANANC